MTDMPAEIADYIRAIADPATLKDTAAIENLDAQLADSNLDPAERLDLLIRRRALEHFDIAPYEAAFITSVPKYIRERGVALADVRGDFYAVGVSEATLDRISMIADRSRSRRGAVTSLDVRSVALSRTTQFTQPEIIELTGASRNTVGEVVAELVDDMKIVDQGGRPKTYVPNG